MLLKVSDARFGFITKADGFSFYIYIKVHEY